VQCAPEASPLAWSLARLGARRVTRAVCPPLCGALRRGNVGRGFKHFAPIPSRLSATLIAISLRCAAFIRPAIAVRASDLLDDESSEGLTPGGRLGAWRPSYRSGEIDCHAIDPRPSCPIFNPKPAVQRSLDLRPRAVRGSQGGGWSTLPGAGVGRPWLIAWAQRTGARGQRKLHRRMRHQRAPSGQSRLTHREWTPRGSPPGQAHRLESPVRRG
jgi:hypothetical protein